MGYETRGVAHVRDESGAEREGEGAILIETDELVVRGPARVKVARSAITDVIAKAGTVIVTHPGGTIALALGAGAEKFRDKLREAPKALVDKLDVKPDSRVLLSGTLDATLVAQVRARTPNVLTSARASACDVVFLAVERDADLPRIEKASAALVERGALWVVHPKGPNGVLDTAIFGAGKRAGLVAVKVARVSDTHTAEKLVRPKR